jgi:hypothetical protein
LNDDLLNAECVIRHLQELQIISLREWQDRNPSDHKYSIYFTNPKENGDISLQIIKQKDRYFIPRSTIRILSYRHAFDTENIFSECYANVA